MMMVFEPFQALVEERAERVHFQTERRGMEQCVPRQAHPAIVQEMPMSEVQER